MRPSPSADVATAGADVGKCCAGARRLAHIGCLRLVRRPHLRRDWAHPATCHICPSTGLTLPTSAPGLGSPRPNLHRDSHASGLRANKLQHGATVPMRQPCAVSYVAALLRARRVHAAVPAACGCDTRIGAWPDRQAAAPTLDRPAHAQQSRPDSCAALPSGLTRPRPSQARPAVARQALGHLSNKQTNKQTSKQTGPRAAARVRSDPSQTGRPHVRTRCGGLPWARVPHPVLHSGAVPQGTHCSGISTAPDCTRLA